MKDSVSAGGGGGGGRLIFGGGGAMAEMGADAGILVGITLC
jgi:hypothetical protein